MEHQHTNLSPIVPDQAPIKLRAVDRAEDAQDVLIDLADQLRAMSAECLYLRGVLAPGSGQGDMSRVLARAYNRVLELCELAGRLEDTRDHLARTLRSQGGL